jgi:hypothetical protein
MLSFQKVGQHLSGIYSFSTRINKPDDDRAYRMSLKSAVRLGRLILQILLQGDFEFLESMQEYREHQW